MKELKDIVLKKGDIVFYSIENDIYSTAIDIVEIQKDILDAHNIIKIERPIKYETIYETSKEILTQEEKEYLEEFVRAYELEDRILFFEKLQVSSKICGIRHYVRAILKDNVKVAAVIPFNIDEKYKGMKLDKEYTLKELGLFE